MVGAVAADTGTDTQPVSNVAVEVDTALEALVTCITDDTGVVDIAETHGVAAPLLLAADGHGVSLLPLVQVDVIPPVDVRIGDIVGISLVGIQLSVGILGGGGPLLDVGIGIDVSPAGVVTGLVEEVHVVDIVLHGVDYLERLAVSEVGIIGDGDLAVLAAVLSGHEDNTVSTPVTIDGAGCSVLQDGNGCDIGGVDRVDTLLDTVNEHERT